MPYIKQEERELLDELINALSERIQSMSANLAEPTNMKSRPGVMNYALSTLIKKVYGEEMKYSDYNEVVGMVECAKLEFYRRPVSEYEDKKIEENGDI